jgi:cell division protein FtsI (penicillin-binding protein 3)
MCATGVDMTATPLQVAAAYAVLANDGVYAPPTMVRGAARAGERVLRAETARAMIALLEQAVADERSTGRAARIPGTRVAGKTGTAEDRSTARMYGSFVGIVPADRPRFVILVGAEVPPREDYAGGTVAAPTFARVAARALR